MNVIYSAPTRDAVFEMLSKHPEWALSPIQIIPLNGEWAIVNVKRSRIYDETLFLISCSFNTYLSLTDTEGYPDHWIKLKRIESVPAFAAEIAREFEAKHTWVSDEEFHDKLDHFINYKLTQL